MHPRQHGGDLYTFSAEQQTQLLDFSANVNPLGLPPQVRDAAICAIDDCTHYPDPYCRALTQALAAHHNLNPNQIICGNGAADLIYGFALAQKPKRAALLSPTFSEYSAALQQTGCQIISIPLTNEQNFAFTEKTLDAIRNSIPRIELLMLCNPNNPTGSLIPPALLLQTLDLCTKNGVFLFVDECFLPLTSNFETHSLLSLCNNHNNLFILHAFTKQYAMPGLRLGYAITSNKQLRSALHNHRPPWSVSIPAQKAGLAALKCTDYIEQTKVLIEQERIFLTSELQKRGILVYPSQTNFLLFYSPLPLAQLLLKHNILIRDCKNFQNLGSGYFRIAVRTHAENITLLNALDQIHQEVM